jgi:anti-sigma B factor antagonist
MTITETSKVGIAILSLDGTLDALTVPELRKNRSFTDPEKTVVLDLEQLDFIDSHGIGAIVGASRQKRQLACDIVLSCMNDRVRRPFEITNTLRLFHIFDDTSAAVDFAATRQSTRA